MNLSEKFDKLAEEAGVSKSEYIIEALIIVVCFCAALILIICAAMQR